jgi:AcrR family transcriptional regulator
MPRLKERTPAMRDRVLDVAVTTLTDGGTEALTARRVALAASTSVAAVYELFGDKGGLVREIFFAGFRRLGAELDQLPSTVDPRRDLLATVAAFRRFACREPVLMAVMFSRPFAEFEPGPDELAAGSAVRRVLVGRVRRTIDAGLIEGDATDIAHGLLALVQGLATQEAAGWLGTSKASRDRRWRIATTALLDGLAPERPS